MNPAICSICGKPAILEKGNEKGDWLQLAGYKGSLDNEMSIDESLHFFCFDHINAASKLIHNSSVNVIEELKKTAVPYTQKPLELDNKAWWKKIFFEEA